MSGVIRKADLRACLRYCLIALFILSVLLLPRPGKAEAGGPADTDDSVKETAVREDAEAEGTAESSGVTFQLSYCVYWQSSRPSIALFVEMTNHGSRPADPSLMEVEVSDGGKIYTGSLDDIPRILVPPGQSFCFVTIWNGYAGADPRITLRYPDDAGEFNADYGFTESPGIIRTTRGMFEGVSFESRNPTLAFQSAQTVNVALYDRDGKLLYVREMGTGRQALAPDSSLWLSWSPYDENPIIDHELFLVDREIASARVFTCFPLEEGVGGKSGDYTYKVLKDGTARLTGYTGRDRELTLPDRLDGYRISSIGKEAIADRGQLVSLTVPEGVETLEERAVARCGSLERVSLPASLSKVEENQFPSCPLTDLLLDSENADYLILDGALFCQRDSTLIRYPSGKTNTGFTVPRGTKAIGQYAFSQCSHLQKIVLPEGLTAIRPGAFYLCDNLSDLVLPDSVTEIGELAFSETAVSSISLPDGIITLPDAVFQNCSRLKSVVLPKGLVSIESYVFKGTGIEEISLPGSLTSIGDLAFFECGQLREVTIPEAVHEIGRGAFACCASLTAIRLPEGTPRFRLTEGMLCDEEDHRIISVLPAQIGLTATVPDGIQTIDRFAFSGLKELQSVQLPDTLVHIGYCAFSNCIRLRTVLLPESLTGIEEQAFRYCSMLETAVLPDGLTEIPDGLFNECSCLKTVRLPRSLVRIGEQAFSKCDALTSLSLPDTVTEIGYAAFAGCRALININFPASLVKIGDEVFTGSPLVQVTVVSGSRAEAFCLENGIPIREADQGQ